MEQNYFSPKQMCNRLCISKSKLARMRIDGSGPVYTKIGRSILYSKDALEDWLKGKTLRSTSDDGGHGHA